MRLVEGLNRTESKNQIMGLTNQEISIYFCGGLLDVHSFVKTSASRSAGNAQSRGRKTIDSIAVLCGKKKKSVMQIVFITCRELESTGTIRVEVVKVPGITTDKILRVPGIKPKRKNNVANGK